MIPLDNVKYYEPKIFKTFIKTKTIDATENKW